MNVQEEFRNAQRLVLSAAYFGQPDVFDFVPIEELDPDLRPVARVLKDHAVPGEHMTLERLTSLCLRHAAGPANHDLWLAYPIASSDAVRRYGAAHGAVVIERSVRNALHRLESGVDAYDVLSDFQESTQGVAAPTSVGTSWTPFREVVQMQGVEESWVLPGLLAHGERLVLTGVEGWGKSLLLYQIALGAAWGVDPFGGGAIPRKRVLVLDVENWHETQVSSMVREVSNRYMRFVKDRSTPDFALMHQRTVDLANPSQRARFISGVADYKPDLLIMGSGYKLADANGDWRQIATAVQRTADQCRSDTGCAVLIETHAGHGFQGDRNGMRPDGSSYWLRWPEFGIGMSPKRDAVDPTGKRIERAVAIVKWRGDRAVGRRWPVGLRAGRDLHWVPWDPGDAL